MSDFAHAHPNKCHWSYGLPDLCGLATRWSAYYFGDGRHSDWIANLCDEHAKQTLVQKIKCVVRERWTGAIFTGEHNET